MFAGCPARSCTDFGVFCVWLISGNAIQPFCTVSYELRVFLFIFVCIANVCSCKLCTCAALLLKSEHLIFFYVLLTVQLSTTLEINQLNAQILFYNNFIIFLHMFRARSAYHQEVKIVFYSIRYRHTYRWPSGAQSTPNLCTGRPPIGVIIPDAV